MGPRTWHILRAAAAAALLAATAVPARAARFGVPAAGDPAGWLVLVGQDTGGSGLADAFGDVARQMTFYIEVTGRSLEVNLYDPGLYRAAGPPDQLDVNLDALGFVGKMRYVLYDPDWNVLADVTYGADTAATDRTLVNLYRSNAAGPGVHVLDVFYQDEARDEQDISVFGIDVPGYDVWTYNLTAGHVNLGGARIVEPVRIYPYLVAPSAGNDALGPVCGVGFHSYDLDADLPGIAPPAITVTSRRLYTFPPSAFPPSGDGRFWQTECGGLPYGLLDSDDHGIYRWEFSRLDEVQETLYDNVAPMDVNVFSVQVLDYGVAPRDFTNWPVLPPALGDNPRRLYLPRDDGSAPLKETLGHSAAIVAGFPTLMVDETSTLEVTLVIDNPNPFPLTNLTGSTSVAPGAALTDPSGLVAVNLTAAVDPLDARKINLSGTIPAGGRGELRYRVDVTPTVPGRAFLTGDGIDFVSPAAPTRVEYETPYVRPLDPREVLGPACQIEYEALPHACTVLADLVASTTRVCPGGDVTLDATGSSVRYCPGGVAIFQWRANGAVVVPFPAASTWTVTPFLDTRYTVDVMCSTDPGCLGSRDLDVTTYPGVTASAGSDQEACAGASVTLTGTASGGTPPYGPYRWSTSPPGQPGDGATTSTITVSPSATTVYTFAAGDSLGCAGRDDVTVTIDAPTPTIAPASPALCPGGSVTLAAPAGFVSYLWATAPPGLSGDGATTASIVARDIGATYTVTVTDAATCAGQSSVTTSALSDAVPGPVGNTLWGARRNRDVELRWQDLAEPAGDYRAAPLACDSDLDGTCDTPALEGSFDLQPAATIAAGAGTWTDPAGVDRPSRLVYYRVRATSPCSLTPGPW